MPWATVASLENIVYMFAADGLIVRPGEWWPGFWLALLCRAHHIAPSMNFRLYRFFVAAVFASMAAVSVHAATSEDAKFEKIANDFVEQYLAFSPVDATRLGDHRFDDRLTDFSAAARQARLKTCRETMVKVALLKAPLLTPENRVDRKILLLNINALIFGETRLKEWAWNPLVYIGSLADSIYLLTARDFAPADARLRNIEARLALFPRVIAQAKENLKHPPKIHTETAIRQLGGAIGLVREDLKPLLDQVSAERKQGVESAQARAVAALEEFKSWMENELLPQSDGDFRIGVDLFRRKLRFYLDSPLGKEQVLARAEADLKATHTAMFETALPLYRKQFPAVSEADLASMDRNKLCRAVLGKLAENHPNNATVVAWADKTLVTATDFVREKNIVRMPSVPLRVIETPEFRRGVAIAYCDSPGPLDRTGETFYAIEPTPPDWKPERVESFFREYNEYMLQDLTIHEAMPGHYLQGAHSNEFKSPTLVRSIFQSGTMVEGWACYGEQVMAELGYGGAGVKMQQLKMRLRLIINAIIDQKIHTAGMTEKEALDLMMNDGFQEEGEAVAKWRRARLTSCQLSTYFVGTTEMLDLRAAARAKQKDAFKMRAYHDALLSHGSPAPRYLRELLGL
jgi:uncharacterized protein (DUF885 family)